ncbi:proton-conducting transporter membrane subunit [Caloramator sp. mosi_1]|uniref:proton-conducting transporter transmembrane domain-containing protein n=1 Tax=Caloramator sp. mosi_1 TaxID=3023090 RepID=UPI0023607A59|nr:proton-conducting transporter membrane subunit [Caloramator sp. mosi_1]WDC85180.1 proton-conducting transporter membrane subunit [Caloramator sp. mosi_1]
MNEYKKEYSITYFWFFTFLFVISMILTVFSSNIISFMVFWELMSISSFFLVIYEHKKYSTIHTGIFYFIMTHISGLTLMIMFALLYKYTGKLYFSDIQFATLNTKQINTIFYLSIIGFGAKAGLIPLHAWLPKAHPAAPSNISSLMSGVMLKVAIYGFILVNFVVVNNSNLINGLVLLIIGLVTAVISILNGIFQKDIKALLAYSSAENVGLIFSTIALSIILNSQNIKVGALVALVAALYHILNHSVFKSLLFANAGSVLFATSTKI